jgi:DNA-binding winged helix-turn-helix (wHTH) protein/tetratricopeptide (TPR) repeat protein
MLFFSSPNARNRFQDTAQETAAMPATYGFSDFEVDLDEGRITRNGYVVPLQDQPFRLLVLLLAQAGTIVTREEIQSHLWPENTFVEFDKSLRVAVSKLREALRDSPTDPIYIETLPRRGYRFIAPVRNIASASDPLAFDALPLPAPVLQPDSDEIRMPQQAGIAGPGWNPRTLPLIFALAALSVLTAGTVYLLRTPLKQAIAPAVIAKPIARRSVAVIGLRNLKGTPEDKWLSTALAEMLSTELSTSDRLRIISGEEVARAGLAESPSAAPSRETLARFGGQLGADAIVYGSYTVLREPGAPTPRIRLDLRLEDLTSNAPPIALVESGPTSDLFSLVSTSGAELRRHYGLGDLSASAGTAVRKSIPENPLAANLYSQGLASLRAFDPLVARDLLQKAAQIEPTHPGTHLALAEAWHATGYDKDAKTEAARAVELGAGLPRQELLNMQGELALFSDDLPHAAEIFHSLVTFYPDDIDYGLHLEQTQFLGSHFADAMATLENMRHRGLSRADEARVDIAEASVSSQTGDFRESVAAADRAIQIGTDLDSKWVRGQALWLKSSGLERLGDAQGSLVASAESQSLFRSIGDKHGLGLALLMSGDVLYDQSRTAEARKNFVETLEIFREIGHRRNMATVEERIGNTYLDEGSLAESDRYYQLALYDYRQLNWDIGVASAIGNIAIVQGLEGDLSGSLQTNHQGLAIFRKTGDKRGIASTLNDMGTIELERGSLNQASDDFNSAEQTNRQISYARGLAASLIGEGDLQTARNQLPGAIREYNLALKAIAGMDEPGVITSAKISLGSAILLSGDPKSASVELQQAVDTAIANKDHGASALALSWLSRCLLQQGRPADALTAANRAVAESSKQFDPQMRLIAMLALSRVQLAQGGATTARAQLRSVSETARQHGYAPLQFEAQVLLAELEPFPDKRHRQLEDLSRDAARREWKLLSAYAKSLQ